MSKHHSHHVCMCPVQAHPAWGVGWALEIILSLGLKKTHGRPGPVDGEFKYLAGRDIRGHVALKWVCTWPQLDVWCFPLTAVRTAHEWVTPFSLPITHYTQICPMYTHSSSYTHTHTHQTMPQFPLSLSLIFTHSFTHPLSFHLCAPEMSAVLRSVEAPFSPKTSSGFVLVLECVCMCLWVCVCVLVYIKKKWEWGRLADVVNVHLRLHWRKDR